MPSQPRMITALIPLPLFYNPDSHGRLERVGEEKFELTAEEVAKKFGGCLLHRAQGGQLTGFWWDRIKIYKDDMVLLEIDIADVPESRRWLESYARDVLLDRFQQRAIYVRFVGPIEATVITEHKISRQ